MEGESYYVLKIIFLVISKKLKDADEVQKMLKTYQKMLNALGLFIPQIAVHSQHSILLGWHKGFLAHPKCPERNFSALSK
jgi:hypothetical protein